MGSEYACVQVVPSNVFCHHTKHRWDIVNSVWFKDNLPSFEYFRKITLTTSPKKAIRGKRFITFIFVNTMNYLHALKNEMFI